MSRAVPSRDPPALRSSHPLLLHSFCGPDDRWGWGEARPLPALWVRSASRDNSGLEANEWFQSSGRRRGQDPGFLGVAGCGQIRGLRQPPLRLRRDSAAAPRRRRLASRARCARAQGWTGRGPRDRGWSLPARDWPRDQAWRITAVAPSTNSCRRSRCPILVIRPSRCRPPVEISRGVSPIQAAKSRPRAKLSIDGAKACTAIPE